LRQGDKTGAVVIDATLMDNGVPVSLDGLTPMFKANTADGQAVIDDSTGFNIVDASSGEFAYQVPNALSSVPGKITTAYFSFSDSSGSESTFDVAFIIKKAVDITQPQADDYITIIDGTLNILSDKVDSTSADIQTMIDNYNRGSFYNKSETDSRDAVTLENAKSYADDKVSIISSGAPMAASQASSMTDKNKNYVYTGTEPGYTPGNWYYWNGSIWASGGVYQAAAIDLDVDGIRNFTPSKTTGSINPFDGTITTTDGVVYYTVDVSNGIEKLTFYSENFSSGYGYAFYNGSGVFIPGTGRLEKFVGYQTIDVPVSATTFRVTSRLETNQKVTLFKVSSSIQTNTKNINDNFVKIYGNKKLLKSKDYQHIPLLISSSTGLWAEERNSSSVLIPISDVGKAVKITSNELNSSSYTFLKTATVNVGDTPDFANGYNGIVTLNIGEYATLQVPSDAGFLYVTNTFDSGLLNDTYPKVTPMSDTVVTVAASNSSTLDKSRADYVATGTNDQDVINQAITVLVYGGTIKLFDGDYYIDSFPYHNNSAIYFENNGYARTINFEGSTENKSFLSDYGVSIHVTKTAFDSTVSGNDYNVFIGSDTTLPIGKWQGRPNNVNFKNFYLFFDTSQKQMVGINGQYFGSMYIEQVGVYSKSYFNDRFDRHKPVTPAINSIGVISVDGANDEMARIGMDTVNVGGLGTGIVVARAEHLILKNCTVSRCVIGYQFNGNVAKPLTLINNADEGNTHLPVFKGTGLITSIDFSIERLDSAVYPDDPSGDTNPLAKELTPGGWKGTFDFNMQGSSSGINNFWQTGSGNNIKTRRISSAISGTDNPSNPEYLQEFFRTDLNKKLIFNGTSWVDSTGNIV